MYTHMHRYINYILFICIKERGHEFEREQGWKGMRDVAGRKEKEK